MSARAIKIDQPAILFRIAKYYKDGMTDESLYDTTRGAWTIDPRRAADKLALAVYRGIVMEVYTIDEWLPAGTTTYRSGRTLTPKEKSPRRREFIGRTAPAHVRDCWLGGDVSAYFPRYCASPFLYVGE